MNKIVSKWPLLLGGSFLLLLLAGVAGLGLLSPAPFVAAPLVVQVTATYPKADAELLRRSVAPALEQALRGVENMRYLRSTACTDSTLVTCVYFPLGTDLDQAVGDVQQRLPQAIRHLPKEVGQRGLRTTGQPSRWLTMLRTYGEARRPRREL
jgi:HAE1 family hydrophobic/amphiphilic exporter-1